MKFNLTNKLGAWAMISLLLLAMIPVTMTTTGCSSNQLKSYATALQGACTSLAAIYSTTNPEVSAGLSTAATSLNALVSAWDDSSAAGKLNTIATAVEVALAAIPATSQYASLVAIAVTAVDFILANTTSSSTKANFLTTVQANNLTAYRAIGSPMIQHRALRSKEGDFKAAWNNAVASDNLPSAYKIK